MCKLLRNTKDNELSFQEEINLKIHFSRDVNPVSILATPIFTTSNKIIIFFKRTGELV
jgi:hypothetical protein